PIRPAFHSPPLLFFRRPQPSTLSPYTTLCRSPGVTMTVTDTELTDGRIVAIAGPVVDVEFPSDSVPEINQALEFTITVDGVDTVDRKSTRLNSSHVQISYAVSCLKKKTHHHLS